MVSSNKNECAKTCWGIAALVGFIAIVLLFWLSDFGFFKAILSGCLIGVLLGFLLTFFVCRGQADTVDQPSSANTTSNHSAGAGTSGAVNAETAQSSVAAASSTPTATTTSATADKANSEDEGTTTPADGKGSNETNAAVAPDPTTQAAPAAAFEMKASKPLAGEKELAERKGEWKYEGKAAGAEASKAEAASQPVAAAKAEPEAKPVAEAKVEAEVEAKPKAKAKPAAEKTTTAAKKPAAKKAAEKKPAAKKAPAKPAKADAKPATLLDGPRPEGKDDLKLISGVGPKLEATLNELGVYHFDQVAKFKKKDIEWVDARLRFKGRIERDDWMSQAKILAKGGETEFSKKKKS